MSSGNEALRRVDDEAFTLPIPSRGLLIRRTASPSEASQRSVLRSRSSPPSSHGGAPSEAAESHFSISGILTRNRSDAGNLRRSTAGGHCDKSPSALPPSPRVLTFDCSTPLWPRQPAHAPPIAAGQGGPPTTLGQTGASARGPGSAKRRATRSPVRDYRARLAAFAGAGAGSGLAATAELNAEEEGDEGERVEEGGGSESRSSSCKSAPDPHEVQDEALDRVWEPQAPEPTKPEPASRQQQPPEEAVSAVTHDRQQQQELQQEDEEAVSTVVATAIQSTRNAFWDEVEGAGGSCVVPPDTCEDTEQEHEVDGILESCRSIRAEAYTDACGVIMGSPRSFDTTTNNNGGCLGGGALVAFGDSPRRLPCAADNADEEEEGDGNRGASNTDALGQVELLPPPPAPWLPGCGTAVSDSFDAIAQLQAVVSGLSEPYQRYIRERALELTRIIDENLQRQRQDPNAPGDAVVAIGGDGGVDGGGGAAAAATPSKQATAAAAALVLAVATSGTQWPYSTPFSREMGVAGGGTSHVGGGGGMECSCDVGASDGSGVRWLFHSPREGDGVAEGGGLHGDDNNNGAGFGCGAPGAECEQQQPGRGYVDSSVPAAVGHGAATGCAARGGPEQQQEASRSQAAASVGSCTMCFGSVLGGSQVNKQSPSNEVTSGALSARGAAAAGAPPHRPQPPPPAQLTPLSCVSSTSPSRQRQRQQHRRAGSCAWVDEPEGSPTASSACSNARSSMRADQLLVQQQQHPVASVRSGSSSCHPGGEVTLPLPRGLGSGLRRSYSADSDHAANVARRRHQQDQQQLLPQRSSLSRAGPSLDLIRMPSSAFEVSYLGRRSTLLDDESTLLMMSPREGSNLEVELPMPYVGGGVGGAGCSASGRDVVRDIVRTSSMQRLQQQQQISLVEPSQQRPSVQQHLGLEGGEEEYEEEELRQQRNRQQGSAGNQACGRSGRPTVRTSNNNTGNVLVLRAASRSGQGGNGHKGGKGAHISGSYSQHAWQHAQRGSMDPSLRASIAHRASAAQRRCDLQYPPGRNTNSSSSNSIATNSNQVSATRASMRRSGAPTYQQLLMRSGIGGPAGRSYHALHGGTAIHRASQRTSPGRQEPAAAAQAPGRPAGHVSNVESGYKELSSTSTVLLASAAVSNNKADVADPDANLATSGAVARMLAGSRAADSCMLSDVLWGSVAPSQASARQHHEQHQQVEGGILVNAFQVVDSRAGAAAAGGGGSSKQTSGERPHDWQPLHTAFKLDSLMTSYAADSGIGSTAPSQLTTYPESTRAVSGPLAGTASDPASVPGDVGRPNRTGAGVPTGPEAEPAEPATGFVIVSRRNTQSGVVGAAGVGGGGRGSVGAFGSAASAPASSLLNLSSLLGPPADAQYSVQAAAATTSIAGLVAGAGPDGPYDQYCTADAGCRDASCGAAAYAALLASASSMGAMALPPGSRGTTTGGAGPEVPRSGGGGLVVGATRQDFRSAGGAQPPPGAVGAAASRRNQLEAGRLLLPDKEQIRAGSPVRPRYGRPAESRISPASQNHHNQSIRPKQRRAAGPGAAREADAGRGAGLGPRTTVKGRSPGNRNQPGAAAPPTATRRPTSGPSGPTAAGSKAAAVPGLRSRSNPHIRPAKQPSRFSAKPYQQQQLQPEPAAQPCTPVKPPSSPPPPQQSQTPMQLQLQTGGSTRSRWRPEDADSSGSRPMGGAAAALLAAPGYLPCVATSPIGSPTTPACRVLHVHSPEDMPLSAAAQHNFQARLAAVDTFTGSPGAVPCFTPGPAALTTATTTAAAEETTAAAMHVAGPSAGLGLGIGLTGLIGPSFAGPKLNSPGAAAAAARPLPLARAGLVAAYGSAMKPHQPHKPRSTPAPLTTQQLQGPTCQQPAWRPAAGVVGAAEAAARAYLSSSVTSHGDSAATGAASASPPRLLRSSVGLQDCTPNILSPPRNYDKPWIVAASAEALPSHGSPSRLGAAQQRQRQFCEEAPDGDEETSANHQRIEGELEEGCKLAELSGCNSESFLGPSGSGLSATAVFLATRAALQGSGSLATAAAAPPGAGARASLVAEGLGGVGDTWARYGSIRSSEGAVAALLGVGRRSGSAPGRAAAAVRSSCSVGQGRQLRLGGAHRQPLHCGEAVQGAGEMVEHEAKAAGAETRTGAPGNVDDAVSAGCTDSAITSLSSPQQQPSLRGSQSPRDSHPSQRSRPVESARGSSSSAVAPASASVACGVSATAHFDGVLPGSSSGSSSNRTGAVRGSREGSLSAREFREAAGYTGLMLARQQLHLHLQQQHQHLQQQHQQHRSDQQAPVLGAMEPLQEEELQQQQQQDEQRPAHPQSAEPSGSMQDPQQQREQQQQQQAPQPQDEQRQQQSSAQEAQTATKDVASAAAIAAPTLSGVPFDVRRSGEAADRTADRTAAPCRAAVQEPSDGAGTALYGGARCASDSGSASTASVEGGIAAVPEEAGRCSGAAMSGRWDGAAAAGRARGPLRTASAGSGGAQLALLRQAAWPGLREPRVMDALLTLEAGIAVLDPMPPPPPPPAPSPPPQSLMLSKPRHGSKGGDPNDGVAAMTSGCFAIFHRGSSAAAAKAAATAAAVAAAAAAATPPTTPPLPETHGSMGQRPILLRMRVADGAVELLLIRPRTPGVGGAAMAAAAAAPAAGQGRGGSAGSAAAASSPASTPPPGPQRIRVAALSGLHPPLTSDSNVTPQQAVNHHDDDLADPASRWLQLVAMDGGVVRLSACTPADHARLVLGLNAALLVAAGGVGEEAPLAAVPLRGLLPLGAADGSGISDFGHILSDICAA
ncbi:hypothetical protein Agub_g5324 [Astrephomene gubernaculifera]|uniref:Uncharacterized protein n=1 Tax=Astrephomene gubernaculifera TaxID=47775 RepID=A0AAD3DLP8_9CHLO|nr:hypothetical protein Agub_g5324 [Astrephomene gubernaculifera]